MESTISLSVRVGKDSVRTNLRTEDMLLLDPEQLKPWRDPVCYHGQKHLPGYFWVSQTRQLVFCESRLEMTILKQLDFEETLQFVLPQPFQITFRTPEGMARHVPDFLMWRVDNRPLLVNVKPKKYLDRPRVRASFDACKTLTEGVRMEHRICSEPEVTYFANLRWLAGFRREPIFFSDVAPRLSQRLMGGPCRFIDWIDGIEDESLVRPIAFHLLWKRNVVCDWSVLLDDSIEVRLP